MQKTQRLQAMMALILRNDVARQIALTRERLENFSARLMRAQVAANQGRRTRLESLERQLASLSPLAVLNRGYALVYDQTGALLKSAVGVSAGQLLSTRLARGTVESRVTKTKQE